MPDKIRIKDIAEMAGVSPGTVDRVIHNRGTVSAGSREAVQKVLEKVNYRPNLHVSALSIKKIYKFVITIPVFESGGYWETLYNGVLKALDEYDTLKVKCEFLFYDQFDNSSCRDVFAKVLPLSPDAVIIGPTYREETLKLTNKLDSAEIPYIFVDSNIEGAKPLAYFSSNHSNCGFLIGKLIDFITPEKSEYALFEAVRTGDEGANAALLRKKGFMDYWIKRGIKEPVHTIPFSATQPERNENLIGNFFAEHPEIHGAVVLSSRGKIIADYMTKQKLNRRVKLICVDLTQGNMEGVKSGNIDFIIGQRPGQQGFLALKTLIKYMVYGNRPTVETYMSMDIITQENIDFYREFD